MPRSLLMLLVLGLSAVSVDAQESSASPKGIFLHHSSGASIWGPNNSATSVPEQVTRYNGEHGLTGPNTVILEEYEWPNGGDNEWERWHRIFEQRDSLNDISYFFSYYNVVIIKSCFYSSFLEGVGKATDTLAPAYKSVANYKWHWRSIVQAMRKRPGIFFEIWTNAPLAAAYTPDVQSRMSDLFCRWAKDTLARGLDPITREFPRNIYVFDYFHLIADANGKLAPQYATSDVDSHPNSAATELVAPLFVRQTFDAALAYMSAVDVDISPGGPTDGFSLSQNYPNPANPGTVIRYALPGASDISISLYDAGGRLVSILLDARQQGGVHELSVDLRGLSTGCYFYRMLARTGVHRAGTARCDLANRLLLIK